MKLVLRTVQDIPVDGIPRHAIVAVDEQGFGTPIAWFFKEEGEFSVEDYMELKGHHETESRPV